MIQQENQKYKFSSKNYINPNSSFKKYVKCEINDEDKQQILKEEAHRSQLSTEDFEESSQINSLNKRGKIQKKKDMNQVYKSETKNIPKNFGVLLKKYLSNKWRENEAIRQFVNNGENKKNFSRQDFTKLFNDEAAAQLSREYFSGFQIIHDLMISEKIQDIKIHLKYISKFYNSTFNKEELDELKLQ
ncbi:unnamed protein product [Paramecium primaurelia]|uniref:Uncharacterized protein n=2 Tax=Paramecium TaxID=5884 RepID=A0A8S1PTD4_PARPR|nr:unnamed protein product [Paramecium primaurelia]CAD8105848.1 unnamed protein product [Paramecium primaurelia]CAD8195922.1 unnamed protein product [Paramecium pentaurelia]